MSEKLRCVHPHIEKTGGTSRKALFEQMFSPREIMAYNPMTNTFIRASDLKSNRYPILFEIKQKLKQTFLRPLINHFVLQLDRQSGEKDIDWSKLTDLDWRVLTGHFELTADKLQQLPTSYRTVVVREPVERLFSQYRKKKKEYGTPRFREMIPFDPNLSFFEFAKLPSLQNYQARTLGGLDLTEFDLVGTTAQLDRYSARLLADFGFNPQLYQIGHKNGGSGPKKPPITAEQRAVLKKVHAHDYELYHQAMHLAR